MTTLKDLLASDLSKLTPEQLADAVKKAELIRDAAPEWSARLLEALHDSGKSWPEISRMTGLSQTTAYRRLQNRP